jgi:deoxyribodipyrimidine photolyase-related protein
MSGHTAWLLAEHLSYANPVLVGASRVLIVESRAALTRPGLHRQKAHLFLSAMRHFAAELKAAGMTVDARQAPSFAAGVRAHREAHGGTAVRVLRPTGVHAEAMAGSLDGVDVVSGGLFLTSEAAFAEWAVGRKSLVMEGFYRWQRKRLDVLMDGDGPVEGRWNFDHENRGRPPRGTTPPAAWTPVEDDIDARVRQDLDVLLTNAYGVDGPRRFPATRAEAHAALADFVERRLPEFGRYQDAMLGGERFMWHSLLAPALNLGLIGPMDLVRAAEAAYRSGRAPIAAVEGFIRQIIGWREYVWGLYRLRASEWPEMNALKATRPLPALFEGAPTRMRCMSEAVSGLEATGYSHHIERLMLFGNLQLLLGVEPSEALDWFHRTHLDGHAWVMAPNVLGMALFADDGRMMTKPYAASGA